MAASSVVRIASAAGGEAARTSRRAGGAPCSTSHAKRASAHRVLPVPGPPDTASGPPAWVTASRWASVRPSRRVGTRLGYEELMAAADALTADWLGLCRRAAEALREVLAQAPSTRERAVETGDRGEGG